MERKYDESEICPDVRRVARAITRVEGANPDDTTFAGGGWCPKWHVRIPAAIAAIEAWLRVREEE